jgi:hypothetical protein
MQTRQQQMTKGSIDGYSNFMGDDDDYKDWYGVSGQSRDSQALERSNFKTALTMLGGEGENVLVARYGHWAFGWIEEIYVKPNTPQYDIACQIESSLADYPVLNDEDFSEEEMNEANKVWANCYDAKERIEYIRKHRNQFEFNNFSDLMNVIRGNWFSGYASELLY